MLTLHTKYQNLNRRKWLHDSYSWQAWLRFFVVPAIGIMIPYASGLQGWPGFSLTEHLFFAGIATFIYHVCLGVMFIARASHNPHALPGIRHTSGYIVLNVILAAVLAALLLLLWGILWRQSLPINSAFGMAILLVVLATVIINLVHELDFMRSRQRTFFSLLHQPADQEALLADRQSSELTRAHFLWNALTGVNYLIRHNSDLAEEYNGKLAACYQYITKNISSPLVPLSAELSFCSNYIQLQQLRFPGGIQYTVHGDEKAARFALPPLTLQILLENAIKHNQVSEAYPLHIQVRVQKQSISICSMGLPVDVSNRGNGYGRQLIGQAYARLGIDGIITNNSSEEYEVIVPLLNYT